MRFESESLGRNCIANKAQCRIKTRKIWQNGCKQYCQVLLSASGSCTLVSDARKDDCCIKAIACFSWTTGQTASKYCSCKKGVFDHWILVQDLIAKQSLLMQMLKQKIELINQQLSQLVEQDKDLKEKYSLVTSVYGVGKQTALFILVYTNGFTAFSHWKKFACYCGIAPFRVASGTSIRGKTRISSLGNKKLKSLLTMCALNTIKKDDELKRYYDRRIAEGKNAMSTINVLRNKLLSRIFAVVNRGTPYLKRSRRSSCSSIKKESRIWKTRLYRVLP